MKGILIDPHERQVSLVQHDGTLESYYSLLDCDAVDRHDLSTADRIVLDQDGLAVEDQAFWRFQNTPLRMGGKALVVGVGPEGTDSDVVVDLGLVLNAVEWINTRFVGMRTVDQGIVPTPHGPGRGIVQVPIFEDLDPVPATPAAAPAAPEPQPEPQPLKVWTVRQVAGGYQAELALIDQRGPRKAPIEPLVNPDLVELRGMLPPGLKLVPRTGTDSSEIVESWV